MPGSRSVVLEPQVHLLHEARGRNHVVPSDGLVGIDDRVSKLARGAYLSRPGAHAVRPLEAEPTSIDGLLFNASQATVAGIQRPQGLLVMAARFPDLAIKYDGIACSLMLKNASWMQAAIQGAATAMGLGSVPIGTGDAVDFERATGLDATLGPPAVATT